LSIVREALRSAESNSSSAARHGSYRAGFTFGILSFLFVAALGVVSTIATARIYGVVIIGEFALVMAPVEVLWVLSTVREQVALIREITLLPARHPRVTQLFAAVFTFSAGLTVGMSALGGLVCWLLFIGPLHVPGLVTPMFASLAGYAIVTNTGWNIDSILSAFVAGRQLFWVRLHEALSFLTIAIVLGLTWHSVWGLVAATIGGSLTALAHRVFVVRHYVRLRLTRGEYRVGLEALPGLLRFGLKVTPGSVAVGISQKLGVWAVRLIAPVATVGAYSRAQTIPERLQQVNMRTSEVLYPTLVGRRSKGDGEGFDRALIDTIRYSLIGMLMVAAVFGGAAHAVLEVFGPGFSRASSALALLLIFPALASIALAQSQALFAVNRPGLTSLTALGRLVVTATLTFVLTPRIGITGPVLALLGGVAFEAILKAAILLPYLTQPLRAMWSVREQLALALAYGAGFGTATAVEHAVPSVGGLLLSLLAGTGAYLLVLLVSGGVNTRDRKRLTETVALARARLARRRDPSPPPAVEPASS
jgi:O-antigen/teichoic acid export membrane protein